MSRQHDNHYEELAAQERKDFSKDRAHHYEQMAYTKDKDQQPTIQQEHILQLIDKIN